MSAIKKARQDKLAIASAERQLIELWVKQSDSDNTRRAYRAAVGDFLAAIGKPIANIGRLDLQGYKDGLLATDLAKSSINQRLAAIKSLLTYASEVGYTRYNIGKGVRLLKLSNSLASRIIEQGDILRIIAAEPNARNHALLTVLYYTGARISEICSLTWQDLTPRQEGGQVTLFGKGGKTRVVKINARIWAILAELRADSAPADPVFASRQGGVLDASQVHRIVKAAAGRVGFSRVSAHWFRHGHASHSLDAGCPVHVLKESLGHASLATTSRYAHARPTESSSDYLR